LSFQAPGVCAKAAPVEFESLPLIDSSCAKPTGWIGVDEIMSPGAPGMISKKVCWLALFVVRSQPGGIMARNSYSPRFTTSSFLLSADIEKLPKPLLLVLRLIVLPPPGELEDHACHGLVVHVIDAVSIDISKYET
jgi:hypothetical protein